MEKNEDENLSLIEEYKIIISQMEEHIEKQEQDLEAQIKKFEQL